MHSYLILNNRYCDYWTLLSATGVEIHFKSCNRSAMRIVSAGGEATHTVRIFFDSNRIQVAVACSQVPVGQSVLNCMRWISVTPTVLLWP